MTPTPEQRLTNVENAVTSILHRQDIHDQELREFRADFNQRMGQLEYNQRMMMDMIAALQQENRTRFNGLDQQFDQLIRMIKGLRP